MVLPRALFTLLAPAVVAAAAALAPLPARADDGDGKDETPPAADGGSGEEEGADPGKADADLREKLKARLRHEAMVSGGVADMTYSFMDGTELDDFEVKGFDLSDLKEAGSWTLGAGSRSPGAATHKLELTGDFTIEVDLVIKHNTPSAMLAFVLNKKVAVLWGQQIVKTSGFKPWDKKSAPPDLTVFREERRFTVKIERAGDVLKLEVNRRPAATYTFQKGELDSVRFAVVAQNVRFLLGPVRIKGKPAS